MLYQIRLSYTLVNTRTYGLKTEQIISHAQSQNLLCLTVQINLHTELCKDCVTRNALPLALHHAKGAAVEFLEGVGENPGGYMY